MDEYISKQKVLDYLNGYLHSLVEGGADTLFDRGQRRALINAIQDILAVKATDVQPVSHWISVKDRLPEDTEPCAVVTENNGLGVSRLMGRNELEWTLFGEPVLYWMALPEPPKGGDPE